MQPIQLQLIPHVTSDGQAYQHLRTIPTADGILSPEDLKGLHLPEGIQFNQGVVIEGKGPIWLYAYLVHECHPAAWVGCYDPRLSGAVVVQTHTKGVSVGSVVMLNLPQSVMKE